MGIINWISQKTIRHASRGDFEYRNRKPTKMKSGGHGEDNLRYLKRHHFSHNIDTEYDNGVRKGHIFSNKSDLNVKKHHIWFPKSWDAQDIRNAGLHVANLKRNQERKNNVRYEGRYNGVSTGIYFHQGKVTTVFPLFNVNKHARRKTYVKYRK